MLQPPTAGRRPSRKTRSRRVAVELFQDPQLNALEEQVLGVESERPCGSVRLSGRTRARQGSAGPVLHPTVTTTPSITVVAPCVARRDHDRRTVLDAGVSRTGSGTSTAGIVTTYSLPFDASYQPDLWGRVRNTVLGSAAAAQVSAADLENTRRPMQAEVAPTRRARRPCPRSW